MIIEKTKNKIRVYNVRPLCLHGILLTDSSHLTRIHDIIRRTYTHVYDTQRGYVSKYHYYYCYYSQNLCRVRARARVYYMSRVCVYGYAGCA